MDNSKLYRAVGEIDDDLLLDAELAWERGPAHPRRHVQRLTAAACFLLIAAGALFWFQNSGIALPLAPWTSVEDGNHTDGTPASQTDVDPASHTDGSPAPQTDGDRASLPSEPPALIDISFNDVAEAPHSGPLSMYALLWDDFVPMTYGEVLDYFGVELPPVEEILPELSLTEENAFGIYQKADGGCYHDANVFRFSDETGHRSVTVSLRTMLILHPNFTDIQNAPETLTPTRINGWDLIVFRYAGDGGTCRYYTEFSQNGAAWYVDAGGLTEQEFAKVLAALVKEKPAVEEPVTVSGTVSEVDSRSSDFFDGEEHHYSEDHNYIVVELEDGGTLTVWLPGEAGQYQKGERVTVTYTGEPATVGSIWPGQLERVARDVS